MSEARTSEKRFVTEWASMEVRMHREGNLYQLEIAAPGEGKGRFIKLTEEVAMALRGIWLT